jgi:hypothetical protein
MENTNPQTTSSSPYQGQMNMSIINNDQILTTDEPSTGASEPTSTPQNANPITPKTPEQVAQAQAQAQPGQQQPQTQPQLQPQLGKSVQQQQQQSPSASSQTQKVQNQQTARASIFHDIAETLAGGPRYTYNVDEYGNMKPQKVPVSAAHLGLAIALEALQGSLTGLSQRGPEAAARGGALALAQAKQQTQQLDQQARQRATEDYQRRAQVTETNMRMYSMARQIGKMDEESVDNYIGQYKDLATKLQQEFPGSVQGPVKYSDFGKYNVTQDNAIPFVKVPRLDANGRQATDARGIPMWDMEYLIVDPKLKASGLFDPDTIKTLKEMGKIPGNSDQVMNTPMQLMMALSLKSQAAQWNVAKTAFGHFFDINDNAGKQDNTFEQPTTAPQLPPQIDSLAETSAKTYGVPSQLIKGIIQAESSGNPNAQSPTGALGLMQLTSSAAKDMGVQNPLDPAQNVDGGTKLFSHLLNQFHDPRLALAAYYSGPGAIDGKGNIVDTNLHTAADTTAYVNKVAGLVGLQKPVQTQTLVNPNAAAGTVDGQKNPESRTDLATWTKNHPSTPGDIEKFMGALSQTEDNYGQAIAHLNASGQQGAAANISAFLGGPDAIRDHDDALNVMRQQRTLDMQRVKQEQLAKDKAANDEAVQQRKVGMLNTLETAKIPKDALTGDPGELVRNLQAQGVTLPAEAIRDAVSIARYDAPMTVASNKRWFKDAQFDQTELLDIVKQLNPDYRDGNFANLKAATNPNSKSSTTISAASGVSNHLNMLLDAAQEIKSKGLGAGQYPALNRLANTFNYQTGGDAYVTLAALTNAINGEMAKVLSGGFAPDKPQIEALMKNMTPANSYNQIQKLVKTYTGIMHGKILPLDEEYNGLSGEANKHRDDIPQSFTTLAQRMGMSTPWTEKGNQPQQQVTFTPQPGVNAQYAKISLDGKVGIGPDGKQYVIATGQPVQAQTQQTQPTQQQTPTPEWLQPTR